MNDEIVSEVIGTIAQAKGLDPETLAPSTSLEELALDSLDRVSLSFDLEERYGIALSEQDLAHVITVSDIAEVVRKAMLAKAAAEGAA